jgi:TRAP-type mannitol/chloroaromatic compound transport system permease small subunit
MLKASGQREEITGHVARWLSIRRSMDSLLGLVDSVSDALGKIAGWLLLPLSFFVTYEVVLRYVFDKPTIWVWDLGVQLQAFIIALGGSYALRMKSHVSIDILVSKLPERKRAILDSFTDVLMMSGILVLLWRLWLSAELAVNIGERWTSGWAPPIYPLKVVLVIAVAIMFFQALANWIRRLRYIFQQDNDGSRC